MSVCKVSFNFSSASYVAKLITTGARIGARAITGANIGAAKTTISAIIIGSIQFIIISSDSAMVSSMAVSIFSAYFSRSSNVARSINPEIFFFLSCLSDRFFSFSSVKDVILFAICSNTGSKSILYCSIMVIIICEKIIARVVSK